MEISGKVHEVFATQQITPTFKKREFVVEYVENPQYPEYLKFDVMGDKCDLLDEFTQGDAIKVSFNLKGRPWTAADGKKTYFNSFQAWRFESVSQKYETYAPAAAAPAAQPAAGGGSIVFDKGVPGSADIGSSADDDDLPF